MQHENDTTAQRQQHEYNTNVMRIQKQWGTNATPKMMIQTKRDTKTKPILHECNAHTLGIR